MKASQGQTAAELNSRFDALDPNGDGMHDHKDLMYFSASNAGTYALPVSFTDEQMADITKTENPYIGLKGLEGVEVDGVVCLAPEGWENEIKRMDKIDEAIRVIGDSLSKGEGGYESYNTGTQKGRRSFNHPPVGTVTSKTINEILASTALPASDKNRMFATGKYQTIATTLAEAKNALGLSGDELYDANMQERIFRDYLIYKAGGGSISRPGPLAAYIFTGKGNIDEVMYAVAKEWASIATPMGEKISKSSGGTISNGTLSYYEGPKNHANMMSTNAVRHALINVWGK